MRAKKFILTCNAKVTVYQLTKEQMCPQNDRINEKRKLQQANATEIHSR